jgi:hypothetical protein
MRATNDNAPTKTIEQAKSEFLNSVSMAIASINELTENLEKVRAAINAKQPSAQ